MIFNWQYKKQTNHFFFTSVTYLNGDIDKSTKEVLLSREVNKWISKTGTKHKTKLVKSFDNVKFGTKRNGI